ncbi:CaiB/BaiF CoA transferase family protein [Thermodesulfobacteriota bacterium]
MSESQSNGNPGPLSGIKVVDLTRYVSGPACTMILSDMGAETIKVEPPGKGEQARSTPPLVDDISGYFPTLNRNKKSITLNLRTDKGKEIFRRLILWGDVLVENYRPGVMQQIGFDYPVIREINPRMIMVSISAYGQTGPYVGRVGFDTVAQAMGGLMSMTGPANSPPMSAGGPFADLPAGIFGVVGTLLALYNRQSSGLGQHVESTLMESVVFMLTPDLLNYTRGRIYERGAKRWPGGTYQAKDGHYIVIFAHDDNHWPLMADILGRQDLANAPGYRNRAERNDRGEELSGLIEAWVRTHAINEVEAALDEAGIPFGRVQTFAEVLKDPNLKARGMFKEVDHYGEVLPLFGPYPLLSDTPGAIRTPCPRLGQHNDEIYPNLLGLSEKEMETLKSDGVI